MKYETKTALKELLKSLIVQGVVIILCLALSWFIYERVQFSALKDVLATLQTLAAIVFAIVGLWVGSLYPNAIMSIVNDDISYISNTKDAQRIEKLVYIIIISACVMLGTLLIYLSKFVITSLPFYGSIIDIAKFSVISFTLYLCWLQATCVLNVIFSNFNFISNLHSKLNKAKLEHKIHTEP
jgi:hypothetical protein